MSFTFTLNGNVQNQQVINNPQGTVIQNNGTSAEDMLKMFEAIKALLQASPASDSYSQQLQNIVDETEMALANQSSQSLPQTISVFTGKVKDWLAAGQNLHDMAITAQTLHDSVSALF